MTQPFGLEIRRLFPSFFFFLVSILCYFHFQLRFILKLLYCIFFTSKNCSGSGKKLIIIIIIIKNLILINNIYKKYYKKITNTKLLGVRGAVVSISPRIVPSLIRTYTSWCKMQVANHSEKEINLLEH